MGEFRPTKKAILFCAGIPLILGAAIIAGAFIFMSAKDMDPVFVLIFVLSGLLLIEGGMLPRVFGRNYARIDSREIVCIRGLITEKIGYMPLSSVRSVTMIVTPLGEYTGLNFIVLNALGAKLTLSFLSKKDCLTIYTHINSVIKLRGGG